MAVSIGRMVAVEGPAVRVAVDSAVGVSRFGLLVAGSAVGDGETAVATGIKSRGAAIAGAGRGDTVAAGVRLGSAVVVDDGDGMPRTVALAVAAPPSMDAGEVVLRPTIANHTARAIPTTPDVVRTHRGI